MILKFASFLGLVLLIAGMVPMNAFATSSITVTPTSIVTGGSVSIVGIEFGAFDVVGVYADGPVSLHTTVTAFNGFFHVELTFQVVGAYSVYVVDYSNGVLIQRVSASTAVTVSPKTG